MVVYDAVANHILIRFAQLESFLAWKTFLFFLLREFQRLQASREEAWYSLGRKVMLKLLRLFSFDMVVSEENSMSYFFEKLMHFWQCEKNQHCFVFWKEDVFLEKSYIILVSLSSQLYHQPIEYHLKTQHDENEEKQIFSRDGDDGYWISSKQFFVPSPTTRFTFVYDFLATGKIFVASIGW